MTISSGLFSGSSQISVKQAGLEAEAEAENRETAVNPSKLIFAKRQPTDTAVAMDATPLCLFWKGFTVTHHEFLDPQTLRLQLEPDTGFRRSVADATMPVFGA
ncbi:hypothetical protein [Billgrantia desiderata]|uniref:hypothetical protein n=1 Tax=Billgrantia desiderata TaxID=52021 RepID=UPI001F29A788|nr:hypothetical protein [Halomonas desiderata]